MISRGYIIGKIIDDLANLKSQIDTRNKLGQTDISKFCEDFFREILNITYKLSLQNLNNVRNNFPGLDLGDKKNRICYQITSQKTSVKINETLSKITEDAKNEYDVVYVFVLGKKQNSYSINKELSDKFSFTESNVVDIDDLLKEIIILEIKELQILFDLFKTEFRLVKIELEPIDENGNFESSYYNRIEIQASNPPKNGLKYLDGLSIKEQNESLKELNEFYLNLSSIPRVTREILTIVVERGKYYNNRFRIIPQYIEKLLNISEKEMMIEIHILQNENIVYLDEDEIDGRNVWFLTITGNINFLFYWLKEERISIRTLLSTMDFTVLDT